MSASSLPRRALRRGLVVLAVAAALTWLPLHSWDDEARVIDRPAPDRAWVRKGKTPWGLGLDVTTSTREVRSTRYESDAREGTPFACERIWILERASTRILQTVGLRLQDALLEVPGLTEVAYFPRADQPLAIQRPPDLFVILELREMEELFVPGANAVEATVVASISRTALPGPVRDDRDPGPSLRLELHVTERAWGLRSSAARYAGIADEFVEDLELAAWIEAQRARTPGVSSPPLALISRDDAGVEELPWPVPERARLYSQSTLGTRDQTVWLVETADRADARERLEDARNALAAAGWDVGAGADRVEARLAAATADRALVLHTRRDEDVPGLVLRHFEMVPAETTVARIAAYLADGGDAAATRTGIALLPARQREALRAAASRAGLEGGLSAVLDGE